MSLWDTKMWSLWFWIPKLVLSVIVVRAYAGILYLSIICIFHNNRTHRFLERLKKIPERFWTSVISSTISYEKSSMSTWASENTSKGLLRDNDDVFWHKNSWCKYIFSGFNNSWWRPLVLTVWSWQEQLHQVAVRYVRENVAHTIQQKLMDLRS
jgi:hypothetical protein